MKPAKFVTARSTVITLLVAISSALLLTCFLPQRSTLGGKPPEWPARLPDALHVLTSVVGLDNIVATSWFATLLALFSLSLAVSTHSQFRNTRLQSSHLPASAIPPGSIRLELSPEILAERLQGAGYKLVGSRDGVLRYVKNMAGYWGNFLIHLGLVVVVLFSLVYVVTQHRLLLRLTSDETTSLTPGHYAEMHGIMPLRRTLPVGVSLTRLEPRFWENDKLEYLGSELSVTERTGDQPETVKVALCDKSEYGSFIVYQMNAYGRAFDLQILPPGGAPYTQRIFLPYPSRRDQAAYGETALEGTDLQLKVKFFADLEKRSMKLNSPPLTLRLCRGKESLGEVTLQPGITEQLGPLTVKLARSAWWTDILLEGSRGTGGIFTGFAVILAGVLGSYCLVPREIIVRDSGGALFVQQLARRFPLFYQEEFAEITRVGESGAS